MSAPNQNIPVSSFYTPFTIKTQLCDKLTLRDQNGLRQLSATSPEENWLPGHPDIPLESSDIAACLEKEVATPELNKMFPYLWLVATQSSAHISPLHEQIVRGRDIVITENPELHLVWANSKIFVKPIPAYLFSYEFWQVYLSAPKSGAPLQSSHSLEDLRPPALGYLRTYYHLIRSESDFRIAKREHLIPPETEWPRFVAFISGFGRVEDSEVSPRYHYGQLRLTRLNFWAKVSLGRWQFQKLSWQYADIFARFYAPILFVFGVFSVVLSAMQVGSQTRPEWEIFISVSAWFSVLSLLTVALIGAGLGGFLVFLVLRELIFALKSKYKK